MRHITLFIEVIEVAGEGGGEVAGEGMGGGGEGLSNNNHPISLFL